jgi:hypothetical protein
MYEVLRIERKDTEHFILNVHYARRWPSISYAFGLFRVGELVGVCTYGTPASAPLKRGLCGDDFKDVVLELNRLCLRDNLKNEGSFLVASSLKMLPAGRVVVSFADTEQGHVGTVYQASNFTYCGLSAKRTDWTIRGREHLHGQTVADEFRGSANRAQDMRDKYGEDFYLKPRSRKHRYVFFVGSPAFKKRARAALRYPVSPYPKAKEVKHDN